MEYLIMAVFILLGYCVYYGVPSFLAYLSIRWTHRTFKKGNRKLFILQLVFFISLFSICLAKLYGTSKSVSEFELQMHFRVPENPIAKKCNKNIYGPTFFTNYRLTLYKEDLNTLTNSITRSNVYLPENYYKILPLMGPNYPGVFKDGYWVKIADGFLYTNNGYYTGFVNVKHQTLDLTYKYSAISGL